MVIIRASFGISPHKKQNGEIAYTFRTKKKISKYGKICGANRREQFGGS